MGNFFGTNGFLDTVAESYFATVAPRKIAARISNRVFRVLDVPGMGPLHRWYFLDLLEDESARPDEPTVDVPDLSKVHLGTVDVASWMKDPESAAQHPIIEPSPYIDLRSFPTWPDLESWIESHRSNLLADTRRKARKCGREVGELRLIFGDNDPSVLPLCFEWKSRQYRETGVTDLFAVEGNRLLFQGLARRGLLHVATLRAGDRIIAMHLGVLAEGRLYWWVPAYDSDLSKYSPGRILLEMMIEESHRRQLVEFDFLVGNEPYKWFYATHVRRVGPLGVAPLKSRIIFRAKSIVRSIPGMSRLWSSAKRWRKGRA